MPTTTTKARPLLLRPWEVAATLAGRKTMLRRVMKTQPPEGATEVRAEYSHGELTATYRAFPGQGSARWGIEECPLGDVGDRLNILEPWAVRGRHTDKATSSEVAMNPAHYQIWTHSQCFENGRERFNLDFLGRWRPQEEMPLWAAKHVVENLSIRVERLGDISEADAIAEGLIPAVGPCRTPMWEYSATRGGQFDDLRVAYRFLWESMYGAGSWDPQKWVWVVGYKPVEGE